MLNRVKFCASFIGIGATISLAQMPATAVTTLDIAKTVTALAALRLSPSTQKNLRIADKKLVFWDSDSPEERLPQRKKAGAADRNVAKANEYFNLAIQKANKGDDRGAISDYNRAIRLYPKFAKAYNNRGLLKSRKQKDPQWALADYNRAIKIDANYAEAYSNRGLLKAEKTKDLKGAITDLNKAIQIDANYAIAYYHRGVVKENKFNDPQGALADYNQAIKLDTNYAIAYDRRGVLKENKLNDSQGALSCQTFKTLFLSSTTLVARDSVKIFR
jgi:tetratricopeptide (TPR) repeat protein